MLILMEFVLRNGAIAMGDHGIKWDSKTLLDLEYAHEFIILVDNVGKINDFSDVLRTQGARIGLNIYVKNISRRSPTPEKSNPFIFLLCNFERSLEGKLKVLLTCFNQRQSYSVAYSKEP